MKQIIFATLLFFSMTVHAQVGIGTASPHSSAQLDITSVTKGLLMPRMTAAQVAAIVSPATGLMVYQTDNTPGIYYFNGVVWDQFMSGDILPVNRGGTGASSFGSGNILFGNGTSAFNTSNNLFWDNANARLGILTTTPAATFQIGVETGVNAENLKWGVMNGYNTLQLGYRQTGWKLKAGNNSGVMTDLVFATTDGTTDVDRMTVSQYGVTMTVPLAAQVSVTSPQANFTSLSVNDKIYYNSTINKVGIFTTSPTSEFQVFGDGNFEYPMKYDNANGAGNLRFGFRGREFRMSSTSNSGVLVRLGFSYYDGTTDAEAMSIDNNGIVEIGKLRAGLVSFPTADGTIGQVLKTNGTGTATWADVTATAFSGVLPIANGGTGSATKNFVDLTTAQTIAGVKTFSPDIRVNGLTIGKGVGQNGENTAIGGNALGTGTGSRNTAIGYNAMMSYNGSSFDNNSSVGYHNMVSLTNGQQNTSMGAEAMMSLTSGSGNTSVGAQSLMGNTGSNNTALGYSSGSAVTTGSKVTLLGSGTNVSSGTLTNSAAIGSDAVVSASNTIQLGSSSVTSVNTSAKLTTGAITFPNTDGSGGQALVTNGTGTATWADVTATAYSGILPIVNGGTGSATKNFVDLTTDQTIAGIKTFSSDLLVNGLRMGRGPGQISNNVAIGAQAMQSNTTGTANTIVGEGALYYSSTNSAITAIGWHALHAETGQNNTAVGYEAGARGSISSQLTNSTFLGKNTTATGGVIDNSTAIGSGANVSASNTIQLGNTSVTSVNTSANVTANSFIKSGGTSSQFLKADGSVDNTGYVVRDVADEATATAAQTSFTLTQTPSVNSKVKMYINGARISNTAYSTSGTTVTYTASANGSYTLLAGDRIQFDFYY